MGANFLFQHLHILLVLNQLLLLLVEDLLQIVVRHPVDVRLLLAALQFLRELQDLVFQLTNLLLGRAVLLSQLRKFFLQLLVLFDTLAFVQGRDLLFQLFYSQLANLRFLLHPFCIVSAYF